MNRIRRRAIMTMALAVVICISIPASRSVNAADSGTFKVYHFAGKDSDFDPLRVGGETGLLKEYVKHPNMTAGVGRFKKGQHMSFTYWYDEVLYGIGGSGKLTLSAPFFTESESHSFKAGDIIYLPKGTKVGFEALSTEPWDLFWVTSPDYEASTP